MSRHVKWQMSIVVVIFCFVFSGFAELGSAKTSVVNKKIGPKVVFQETTYDAGKIKEGDPLIHDFVVMNKGDEVLNILKVKPG